MKVEFIKYLLLRTITTVTSFLFLIFVLELGFRTLLPQPLQFYNLNKIMRISPDQSPALMLIPNSKSNYYGKPNEINSFGLRNREFRLKKMPPQQNQWVQLGTENS